MSRKGETRHSKACDIENMRFHTPGYSSLEFKRQNMTKPGAIGW